MSGKNAIASLIFTFFTGLFLCSCGNIKGPKFPHIVSPRVIVETPASPVSGNISISFQLIDKEQESAGVALEYSTDAGQTFHTATLTNPAEATGLASDWHPGVTHTIQWDSVTDMIGLSGPADVCVRVAPSDASNPSGTADTSSTFTVNNIAYNQAPAATVSTPAGIQSGNIQITYTLTDAEGDTCSITVLYSGSGGTTWATAIMGPAGDGLTGLSASPSGISHTFLWNSRTDNVGLTSQQDNVRIRITPTDFKDGTAGETNSFSVDNRIFTDFSASPRSGEAPLLVSFTDASTAFSGITSWSWDFGDGGTSTDQHPDHTYTAAGSYTVSLTVAGPDGTDSVTKAGYIIVTELPVIDTFYVATTGNDTTGDGTVDSPYATIQKGLDSATSGTTVIVFDGTYTGTGNKDLDFNGKSIHLKSCGGAAKCIIDCENSGRGLYFHSGESSDAIVEGFTIQNGNASDCGGGIYCINDSSPTITDCIIDGNTATEYGGGIYCSNSNATIENCRVVNNRAGTSSYGAGGGIFCGIGSAKIIDCIIMNNKGSWQGGGILCSNSAITITNCLITNNIAGDVGGGIDCADASPTITNCTIVSNLPGWQTGGVHADSNAHPTLNNCIIWGNAGAQTGTRWGATMTLNYCYTSGDPLLVDNGTPGTTYEGGVIGEYHLQAGSPCIDAGNNSYVSGITTDLDGNPRITNGTVDIGAYERRIRTWVQHSPANEPSARWNHSMAYDSTRGVVVLFGGEDSGGRLDDTWEYDGTNWIQISPANKPSARNSYSMAYDSSRGVVVLFGGYNGGRFNDTWEWNGTNWTQRSPVNAPSERSSHSMIYDSSRGVVVLFGGWDGNYLDDTWEYDGTNWVQRSSANKPSARRRHAMAYDSNRQVAVLFGGEDAATYLNDTWEWDGTNWTQKAPANSPSPRYGHRMAYDSTRGMVVLFGGYDGNYSNDTWEWDGTDWTQQFPMNEPSLRRSHGMVYDEARGVFVLFGGFDGSNCFAGTWEY